MLKKIPLILFLCLIACNVPTEPSTTPQAIIGNQPTTISPTENLQAEPTEAMMPTAVPATISPTETAVITPSEIPPTPIPPTLVQPTQQPTPAPTIELIMIDNIEKEMLEYINRDRIANGLSAVKWDPLLANVATAHAEDMAFNRYMSHWNLAGYGPDHRYSLSGGTNIASENLFSYNYTYEDGRGAPITNWDEIILKAESDLMNSPGHRKNILNPTHTHVGIGWGYDEAAGQFRLAQEFGSRWIQLAYVLPLYGTVGQTIEISGQYTLPNIDNRLLAIGYEPFPYALSVEALNQTDTYLSKAENIDVVRVDTQFSEPIELNHEGKAGIYHVRLYADWNGQQYLLYDQAIWVE